MAVTRHADPRAFAAAAAPLAARNVATAATIESWLAWLEIEPPASDERVYLATYARERTAGLALRRRSHPVRIEDSDVEAAIAFAHDLAGDWPQLQGVVGDLSPCEAFAGAWRETTGRAHSLRFRLRTHRLTAVRPVAPARGRMRVASLADEVWLVAAFAAFTVEARLPDDPARAATLVPAAIARGELRIWQDEAPVAYARWTGAGRDAARVGPVWTEPHARGRGHATSLVATLAAELLASGRRSVFLDTDIDNPTSNAIYARIGFRPLRDFFHFDFVAP